MLLPGMQLFDSFGTESAVQPLPMAVQSSEDLFRPDDPNIRELSVGAWWSVHQWANVEVARVVVPAG
jgi:hypothetical protein